jgi:hypothetical protein
VLVRALAWACEHSLDWPAAAFSVSFAQNAGSRHGAQQGGDEYRPLAQDCRATARILSTEEARAEMMAHSPVSDLNFLIRRLFLHERNELVEIL